MVLLPCFLGYFIWSEFQKEKEVVKLESRTKVFEMIFNTSDTSLTSGQFINVNGKNMVWQKKQDANLDCWEFKLFPDSIRNTEFKRTLGSADSIFSDILIVSIKDSMPDYIEEGAGNIVSVFEHLDKDSDSQVMDPKLRKLLNQLEYVKLGRGDKNEPLLPMGMVDQQGQAQFVKQVLFRILPQIVFSVGLLLLVYFSFYLILKTLKKQKLLNTLRNDLMSNMTHELKTPVSTIRVALEALSSFEAGSKPALLKEYLDISRLEIDRLGLLVDKALNHSLYEQGAFVLDKQRLDLDKEILWVKKILKIQLNNQNIEFNYSRKGECFMVMADQSHLLNVIHNLIENGIKYTEGKIVIDVQLKELDKTLELKITDNGCGISKVYQDKIFDKFFRVPQGNVHTVKGHGLGLSYVKKIIEEHGGHISVDSKLDHGSTFKILLPKYSIADD